MTRKRLFWFKVPGTAKTNKSNRITYNRSAQKRNEIISDTNKDVTHQPKTEGDFMIFAILPVVLIVALVMLIMQRNGTKVSFVKFDYYLRKSKLGVFLEFVFL